MSTSCRRPLVPRRLVTTAVAALLVLPAVTRDSRAADRVTVVMRDGEAISGHFEDLANNTVFVRVSLHDQRRLPLDGVLYLNFAGGTPADAEIAEARGDDHLLVMRNGSRSRGRLLGIEGGEGSSKPDAPRLIIFRTASGEERRVRPADVARVFLGRHPQPSRPAPEPAPMPDPPPGPGLAVPANAAWTRTGIIVQAGDFVTFSASGRIRLSSDPNDVASPDGALSGRMAPNAPLPGILAGALIGRVGTSAPFGIGGQTTPLRMPASGELWLGINDDGFGDNGGEFRVVIQHQPQARPRR